MAFKNSSRGNLPSVPPDVQQSAYLLGATCGPVALAALFGTTVLEVMRFFPEFPERNFVTDADMSYALRCSGAEFRRAGDTYPLDGLVLVQLEGKWTTAGTPLRAQLRYTHWIACRDGYVFDLNIGDWLDGDEWVAEGTRLWIRLVPGSTAVTPRASYAITPRPFEFSPFGRVPRRSAR